METVSFNTFTFKIMALQDRYASQPAKWTEKLRGNTWTTKVEFSFRTAAESYDDSIHGTQSGLLSRHGLMPHIICNP